MEFGNVFVVFSLTLTVAPPVTVGLEAGGPEQVEDAAFLRDYFDINVDPEG